MFALRLIVAFLAGFFSEELLVLSAGLLAARAAPAEYFQYFGAENRELALGLLSTATFALPQFIVATATSFLAASLLRFSCNHEFVTYLLGAATCHGLYAYVSGFGLAAHLPHTLWQLPAGPWGAWLGMLTGLWLYQVRKRRHVCTEALYLPNEGP